MGKNYTHRGYLLRATGCVRNGLGLVGLELMVPAHDEAATTVGPGQRDHSHRTYPPLPEKSRRQDAGPVCRGPSHAHSLHLPGGRRRAPGRPRGAADCCLSCPGTQGTFPLRSRKSSGGSNCSIEVSPPTRARGARSHI